jgi:hypothetical protein
MKTFRTVLEQKIWERRQTFEEFAEYAEIFAREHKEPGTLGVRHLQRLAAGQGPRRRALGPVRPATARLLEHILGLSVDELLAPPAGHPIEGQAGRAGRESAPAHPSGRAAEARPSLATSFEWLDGHAEWMPDTSRRKVTSRAGRLNHGDVLDRHTRRSTVGRGELARALADYYAQRDGYEFYRPSVLGMTIDTSIVSRLAWLDLGCLLTPVNDQVVLTLSDAVSATREVSIQSAVDRLAEAAILDVRVANAPLYRLLDVDISRTSVAANVGLAPFAEYALTMDLLEAELIDSIAHESGCGLKLRAQYLPDLASVLDFRSRLCAGGVLGLCAIARPADPYRGGPDYALLVQERSGHVLNAASRLAVIPKGFHQPLKDVRADTRIGATLLREMEEELFGRGEVDSTAGNSRIAAPMHPNRLSEPMRWLLDDASRMRIECTGFGLNLVSGNYEFACLIVIEDEEFWPRFGGEVEANWEAAGLRLYSSLDSQFIAELITDETWSNEGLFAFLQGLRRLREVGGRRVDYPTIELGGQEADGQRTVMTTESDRASQE